MTPERKYLTRGEIVDVIKHTVPDLIQAQLVDHLSTVNGRLDSQDKVLAGIQSSVTSAIGDGNGHKGFLQQMHEDNGTRFQALEDAVGRVAHSNKNILQLRENDKLIDDTRREERDIAKTERDAKWDEWRKWITVGCSVLGALVGIWSALGLTRLIHTWILTGHFFPQVH